MKNKSQIIIIKVKLIYLQFQKHKLDKLLNKPIDNNVVISYYNNRNYWGAIYIFNNYVLFYYFSYLINLSSMAINSWKYIRNICLIYSFITYIF